MKRRRQRQAWRDSSPCSPGKEEEEVPLRDTSNSLFVAKEPVKHTLYDNHHLAVVKFFDSCEGTTMAANSGDTADATYNGSVEQETAMMTTLSAERSGSSSSKRPPRSSVKSSFFVSKLPLRRVHVVLLVTLLWMGVMTRTAQAQGSTSFPSLAPSIHSTTNNSVPTPNPSPLMYAWAFDQSERRETPVPSVAPSLAASSIVYDDFDQFPQCNRTTQEMIALDADVQVEPCILFDIAPQRLQIIPYRTQIITIVQVTPATSCRDARDGATTSVELLNQQNDGRGIAIGFQKDYHIQLRFVSLIAGNPDQMGRDLYGLHHAAVLTSAITHLKASYIVGACSWVSSFEKEPALLTNTMVLSQVGPPGFYKDQNPYVFGVHINSDEYPIPAVRALGFSAVAAPKDSPQSLSQQPVIVIYRTHSEFFRSTCESAVRTAKEFGFTNVTEVIYDPEGDHDNDGVFNQVDEDFLRGIADDTCPPGSGAHGDAFNPAIFACFLAEQDVVLRRWQENGCRPISLWLTAATWGWAAINPTVVPHMQGGGQWHEAFLYSDRFFESGKDVLVYNEQKFGYYGSYDTVVAYAIPMIFAQHMEAFYRVVDDPDPDADFYTEEGYERLRRAMVVINTQTIFGPLAYNEDQRNIGRGAAGTQWQMQSTGEDGEEEELRNVLVSPANQAEAVITLPAPSAVNCTPGNYVNETLVITGDAILGDKCEQCSVDSFMAISNQQLECMACPEGSTTDGSTGATNCIVENDNLLSPGTLAFGYLAATTTWVLSLGFTYWIVKHRKDPVVLLSQFEFLVLICLGAIISSSTIFALGAQAGSDEDTTAASRACQAAPFLYTTGWVLQYASLSAKSIRLYKIMTLGRRVKVTVMETASIVAAILALDWIVVIVWTIAHPLEYVREVVSVEVDDVNHVTTINTRGSCAMVDGPSIWAFVGPIIGIHAALMIGTNVILYYIRTMSDRYQEQKYVALASVFVCEVLVIGLPVVISVNEDPVAVFIVLSGVIALNDIGMLCFVFVPKIKFRRKGIQDGVSFGETILKSTHKKANVRESVIRSSFQAPSMSNLNVSSASANRSSNVDLLPSIIDGDEDEDESEKNGPSALEQAVRDDWKRSLVEDTDTRTPPTEDDNDEDEGERGDNSSNAEPNDKYEEVKLRNYTLELEMEELRGREKALRKRVKKLEELLVKKNDQELNRNRGSNNSSRLLDPRRSRSRNSSSKTLLTGNLLKANGSNRDVLPVKDSWLENSLSSVLNDDEDKSE
ncbi:Gamma-aminobutyric acid (GABA) B receptor [Seminavis robusta]|uniref:Gamma-aminobutyric acid (GABA) B receptor n=1 Tax=Seminavis robusta TaxID=568900 RepID=A0A9N8E486_9STRA|nr:Gamma-aminobutyric acid (GABA) B receptor [Seminavis robusta]|eukprot:Sro507_g156520.1 Gamma-aminobutyric acid (GABA) B receptor (1257) ;mRNA; f:29716-33750